VVGRARRDALGAAEWDHLDGGVGDFAQGLDVVRIERGKPAVKERGVPRQVIW
jgi:hypothetical protein